jgi:hypothetical protein
MRWWSWILFRWRGVNRTERTKWIAAIAVSVVLMVIVVLRGQGNEAAGPTAESRWCYDVRGGTGGCAWGREECQRIEARAVVGRLDALVPCYPAEGAACFSYRQDGSRWEQCYPAIEQCAQRLTASQQQLFARGADRFTDCALSR